MRKKLIILCLFSLWTIISFSQARVILPDSSQITTDPDSLNLLPPPPEKQSHLDHLIHDHGAEADSLKQLAQMISWTLDTQTGDRIPQLPDTLLHNYQQTTLPDGYSVAMGFLAPLGSPSFSKIFFDRKEPDYFVFKDAYYPYLKHPQRTVFMNTRVPYARLNYQTGGGDKRKEERFMGLLTSNFGKKLNVGLEADLINARGFYNSQATKHNNFLLFGNYLSDRVEAHAFASLAKITNFENGGITDELFIREPDSVQQRFTSTDVPVKFTNTWNRVKNNQVFLSGRYNLGYVASQDSLHKGKGEFVPVASIVLSSHYTQQYRRFLSYDTTFVDGKHRIDQFYPNSFYNGPVSDSTHFTSLKNTVALSLREGFKPWVKFGLTAFVEHDLRNYSLMDSTETGRMKHRENSVTIGGVLNKQQGEHLRFNVRADLGVLGANLGELRVAGNVETGFNIAGKRTTLSAEAYLKNLKPKYLQEHYHSKYYWWDKELGDTRRVYVGGKLYIPFTNTTLSAGVENLQNYIYFDQHKNIAQESGNVQVLSARVDQNLRFGIFNWDNQVVYQTSSNQEVIPVPMLSLYTNIYLQAKIVNELTLQFGVDAHYHTRYYAQGYEPALLQFYNQREKQVGNYPISTVYANMHLKQTRFFLMFYNVASAFWKPREYFSLPGYPVNPLVFKVGVSVNLHN